MKFTNIRKIMIGMFMVGGLLATAMLHGQEPRYLDVGTMGIATNSAFTNNDIAWPRGVPSMWNDINSYYGIAVGTELGWIDESNTEHSVKVAQVQPGKYTDIERVTVEVPGAFARKYRYPYPEKWIDGENWTDIRARQDMEAADNPDPNLPSDSYIYNHVNTWTGIDIERWIYGFANKEHGDFMIVEYKFTNTSGEDRTGVYINLTAQLIPDHTQANQPADQWADYYGNTYWQYAENGDMTADSMRIQYSWSGDEVGVPQDNKAKPNPTWGHFQDPHYAGHLVLHADTSPSDESDEPQQPFKAGWANWSHDLNQSEQSQETLYDILSNPWPSQMSAPYARMVDADDNDVSSGYYRELKPGIDVRDFNSGDELAKTGLLFFGPYDMADGEDVRVVTAFVAGSIPPKMAIDLGRAYDPGYSELHSLEPLPYDILHPRTGEVIVAEGEVDITKDQKDAVIDSIGRYNMFQTASKVRQLWEGGNVRYGQGSFNVPLAPASPSFMVYSENEQIRLEWGDEAANDNNANVGEIVGYKIYRNYYRPPAITRPTDTSFVMIDSVGPDVREYVDTSVIVGEEYYYYLTAVTDDGVESSIFLNRTGTSNPATLEALTPTRAPSEQWQEEVVVVPNPYHTVAANKYQGSRINFMNLPAYANIRIYTMAGDLVQVLEHAAGTGEEEWQYQDTFSTIEIVSGIYYFVVEQLDGPNGNPTGKLAKGKFVVIK